MKCALCDYENDNLKLFSTHLRSVHNVSSRQYTIDVLCEGKAPTCRECGTEDVRYVSFSFKKYCKIHAKLAMADGGKKGGIAEAWNHGKTRETDERVARCAEALKGEGNPFYGHKHSPETVERISRSKTLVSINIEKRIIERQHEFELITSLDDYYSRQKQYLEFKCLKCGTVQPKTLQAFERGSRCYRCFPESKSNWELEVFDFVKTLASDAESGNRIVLAPKEIDVYVPSKGIGIECHGLYWHSEGSSKENFNKRSHLEKLINANAVNVKLYQLFYDEWRDKRSICESLIAHKLGVSSQRLGAREFNIVELNTEQQRDFFDSTHISSYTPAKVVFGLAKDDVIFAALGLRVPRQASKYDNSLEISRYSTAVGYSIPGGLNRLMNCAVRYAVDSSFKSLVTYVDRRFGDGHGYLNCRFSIVGDTGVDYFYTDNMFRYDRFKFRARGGLTERQVASQAGVSRIYGCGSLVLQRNLL